MEEKVRQVVEKKEAQVQRMKEEVKIKENQCKKYEELLHKQRKDLSYNYD